MDMVHEIYPGLWLGDIFSSTNETFLSDKKITAVINCTVTLPFSNLRTIKHKDRLAVKDNLEKDQIYILYNLIDDFAKLIHDYLDTGHNVLVHCFAGRQRSLAIVAGFIMKYTNLGPDEAVSYIRDKRSVAGIPQVNFISALKQYHNDLIKIRKKNLVTK
jgi:protein-tyrosine phosphatase